MNIKIKKRVFIAVIITIIIDIITLKQWFVFEPVPVSLYLMGGGNREDSNQNCNIEVQLSKKDDNSFNKIKTDNKKIKLDGISELKFNIIRSRFPKRFRLIICDLDTLEPLYLWNIKIGNKTYNDFKNYSSDDAVIKIQNNKLVIYPKKQKFIILYNKSLNVRAKIKFEFELLIILTVLTFLAAYKIADYTADFNTVQGKSKIELIFLVCLFLFLYIPMMNISDNEISVKENRMLAKFKLRAKELEYIKAKGIEKIYSHACDFIKDRIAPKEPDNDGKQTPMRGHPVFIAQHATATCCRNCIEKWYKIPKGRELTKQEQEYLVSVIMEWIKRQVIL